MRLRAGRGHQMGRVEGPLTTQVLMPVPLHRGAGVEVSRAVAVVTIRLERGIQRRVQQDLRGGLDDSLIAAQNGGDRSEIPAGAVAADRDPRRVDTQLGGMFYHPAER